MGEKAEEGISPAEDTARQIAAMHPKVALVQLQKRGMQEAVAVILSMEIHYPGSAILLKGMAKALLCLDLHILHVHLVGEGALKRDTEYNEDTLEEIRSFLQGLLERLEGAAA